MLYIAIQNQAIASVQSFWITDIAVQNIEHTNPIVFIIFMFLFFKLIKYTLKGFGSQAPYSS
jgi:hypothetical protein